MVATCIPVVLSPTLPLLLCCLCAAEPPKSHNLTRCRPLGVPPKGGFPQKSETAVCVMILRYVYYVTQSCILFLATQQLHPPCTIDSDTICLYAEFSMSHAPRGSPNDSPVHRTDETEGVTLRERRNWRIFSAFARNEYPECLHIIEKQLRDCNGLAEYPLYVKGELSGFIYMPCNTFTVKWTAWIVHANRRPPAALHYLPSNLCYQYEYSYHTLIVLCIHVTLVLRVWKLQSRFT